MHKQQGWLQAWEYCQAKLIQTLGRASQGVDWSWSQCIKSHHAQTSSGKGLPSHFWNRNNIRSILPGLRRKSTVDWLLLSGPKSLFSDKGKFCISLGNQGLESGGILEMHRIQAVWSPVWSFRSQWWSGVPWHLLVLVHCVLSCPKSMQRSTRRFWSTLCLHLLTSFMEMLISFSSRTLAPAHSAKTTSKWFADHDITVLDWPANSPDLNPIKNLWGIVKRKISNTRPNNTDELKAAIKAAWASIMPQQCHRLIASMPRYIEAVISAKGAPIKYCVNN